MVKNIYWTVGGKKHINPIVYGHTEGLHTQIYILTKQAHLYEIRRYVN